MCMGAGMTGYVWVLTCDRVARNRSGKRTGDSEGTERTEPVDKKTVAQTSEAMHASLRKAGSLKS